MKSEKRCDKCLYSRLVVSENGFHSVCTLSSKVAVDCFLGKNDRFVNIVDRAYKQQEVDYGK